MGQRRTAGRRRRGAPLVLALCSVVAVAGGGAVATAQAQDGLRYQDAVSARRVQRDIRYAERGEALDLEQAAAPRREDDSGGPEFDAVRPWLIVAFGVILAFVLAAVVRHGGGLSSIFAAKPAEGRRAPGDAAASAEDADAALAEAAARSLEDLKALPDRRLALSALMVRALAAAAQAHDMRLGRSQTARDVLRATPRSWTHHGALARLIRAGETVVFGGREMSDPEFDDCLALARPILAAAGPSGEGGR